MLVMYMTDKKQYSQISFYEPQNEERYNEYAAIHNNMSTDEIVWRVNNNLDKEKYKYVECVTDFDNPCIIVNKYFKLPEDYCPPDLAEADGRLMRKAVAEAYIKMRDAARSEGFTISVSSAYRSAKDQEDTYNKYLGSFSLLEIVDITGYAAEPWHLRYVVVDISTDMVKRNIKSLEEYSQRFINDVSKKL